jgi:hypothetical protein
VERLRRSALVLVAVGGALSIGPASVAAKAQTASFAPSADTYVTEAKPKMSHADATQLLVVGSPSSSDAFLRFTVDGLDAPVTSAMLRLVVTHPSTTGGIFGPVSSTTWPESITWDTKPAIDGRVLATVPAVPEGAVVSIDVSSVVTGNGDYAFAITAPSGNSDALGYASADAPSSSSRPSLVVAYGS